MAQDATVTEKILYKTRSPIWVQILVVFAFLLIVAVEICWSAIVFDIDCILEIMNKISPVTERDVRHAGFYLMFISLVMFFLVWQIIIIVGTTVEWNEKLIKVSRWFRGPISVQWDQVKMMHKRDIVLNDKSYISLPFWLARKFKKIVTKKSE